MRVVFPALTTSDLGGDDLAAYVWASLDSLAPLGAERASTKSIAGSASITVGSVFVEIEVDLQEGAAFALVGLLEDGEIPGGYYVDSNGKRVRWHLTEAVKELRRDDLLARLRECQKQSGVEAIRRQVDLFIEVLNATIYDLPRAMADLRSA